MKMFWKVDFLWKKFGKKGGAHYVDQILDTALPANFEQVFN